MKKQYLAILSIIFVSCSIFAQTKEDVKKITAGYNMPLLKEKESFFREKLELKKKAVAKARIKLADLCCKRMKYF